MFISKILTKFAFDKSHPQSTPMIANKVANQEREQIEENCNEEIPEATSLEEKVPHQEAVGSLLYLAAATRPDISYAVNILSRHKVNPTAED